MSGPFGVETIQQTKPARPVQRPIIVVVFPGFFLIVDHILAITPYSIVFLISKPSKNTQQMIEQIIPATIKL
jgi:hypothetical protein